MANEAPWDRVEPDYLVEIEEDIVLVSMSVVPDRLIDYMVDAEWMDHSPDKRWQAVRFAAQGLQRVKQAAIAEDAEAIILADEAQRWHVVPPEEWKMFLWKHSTPVNAPFNQEEE